MLWAVTYISVGWIAAGSYRQLSAQLHYAGYLFAGIIALFAVIVVLVKKAVARAEARLLQHPDAPPVAAANDEVPGQ